VVKVNCCAVVQISSTETQVAAAAVTTEGLILGRGSDGAWDSAAVGSPVVRVQQQTACDSVCNLPPDSQQLHAWEPNQRFKLVVLYS
jgi:hypothetical protein